MDINLIYQLIPLVVGTSMLAHPELPGDALQRQIEGDLRHATRAALGQAGFLVDFLWSYAPIQDQIRTAIAREVAKVEAQRQNLGRPGSGPGQQALSATGPQEQGQERQEQGQDDGVARQNSVAQDAPAGAAPNTAEDSRKSVPQNLVPLPTVLLPPPHFLPPGGQSADLPRG